MRNLPSYKVLIGIFLIAILFLAYPYYSPYLYHKQEGGSTTTPPNTNSSSNTIPINYQQNVNTDSKILSIKLRSEIRVYYKDGTNELIGSPDINFQDLGKLIELMIFKNAKSLSIMKGDKEVDYIVFKFFALIDPEKEPLICDTKTMYMVSIKTLNGNLVWSQDDAVKRTYVLFSEAKYPILEYIISADEISRRINYNPGTYDITVEPVFLINTNTTTYRASTTASVRVERPYTAPAATTTPTVTAVSSSATSSDAWEVVQQTQTNEYTAYVEAQRKAEIEAIKYGSSTATGYSVQYSEGQPVVLDPAGNMHCYGYRELPDGTKVYPYTVDSQGHLVANPTYFTG